jgi:hypothetical protein
MVSLAFYFQHHDLDVFSGRRQDVDAWNYSAKSGEINEIIMADETNNNWTTDGDVPHQFVDDLSNLPGTVAYFCPHGETSLWSLDHAAIDVYAFGPASGWDKRERQLTVYIPGIEIHAQHAAAIAMAHRRAWLEGLI